MKGEHCQKCQPQITFMSAQSEIFSAFTHGTWAHTTFPHSFSVTNSLVPAEDKDEPSIVISIIHRTEDCTRNVAVSENPIAFKVRK